MPSFLTLLAQADKKPGGLLGDPIVMMVIMVVMFYFLLIRPQQKRAKEHQAEIAAVKKGDEVITGGGLRGRVTKVSDSEIEVEIAQGVRVRAVKSTITAVVKPTAGAAND